LLLLPNTELTSKNTFVFALGAEFVCARFISQSCAPFSQRFLNTVGYHVWHSCAHSTRIKHPRVRDQSAHPDFKWQLHKTWLRTPPICAGTTENCQNAFCESLVARG
jgi:hypothetical protein